MGCQLASAPGSGSANTASGATSNLTEEESVGVGITITHDPLHGSGRAGLPHPALALGDNAHAAQRIGMTDRRQRQPASDEAPHSVPENPAVLAPPRQRAMPIPTDSESKHRQRRLVLGHSVVARFPREVLPYVLGVSDRAGLWYTSRYRCTGWGLPHLLTASSSRSNSLTRLNTRPAHSLVNASTPPSRAAPHDSGSMWVADPLSYDSFIHYTSPV